MKGYFCLQLNNYNYVYLDLHDLFLELYMEMSSQLTKNFYYAKYKIYKIKFDSNNILNLFHLPNIKTPIFVLNNYKDNIKLLSSQYITNKTNNQVIINFNSNNEVHGKFEINDLAYKQPMFTCYFKNGYLHSPNKKEDPAQIIWDINGKPNTLVWYKNGLLYKNKKYGPYCVLYRRYKDDLLENFNVPYKTSYFMNNEI